jgi:Mn2+/Fe2+ NRAMP family transporter
MPPRPVAAIPYALPLDGLVRGRASPTWMGRSSRRLASLGALVIGPGALAMLGENDGPSMLSYAASGAGYGIGFFLPFILVTFAAAYVVQEMAMRLGAVTGRGYGELVFQRFGRFWGWTAAGDLILTNLITLVTEVIAIRLGMGFFGVPAWGAVACAIALVTAASLSGRYSRWEQIAAGLAAFNLVFVLVAVIAHPAAGQIVHATATWSPLPNTDLKGFLLMAVSNIGATVTPWMLFFQQSATVDKGMTVRDLRQGRLNTAAGAVLAAVAGCGALVAASVLFTHHVDMSRYLDGAGYAQALQPIIGRPGATLFALGLVEAGAVAMLTVSASSAYAVGEIIHGAGRSFDKSITQAPLFHGVNIGMTALAGAVVLIPGAPLMSIALNANLLATILMPAALVFLLILAGDREVMAEHVNGRGLTLLGVAITVLVTLAGAAFALTAFLGALGVKL